MPPVRFCARRAPLAGALLLVASVLAAGCAKDDGRNLQVPSAATSTLGGSSFGTPPSSTTTTNVTVLSLRGDGLSDTLRIGNASGSVVRSTLASVFGEPVADDNPMKVPCESGANRLLRWGGIYAVVANDRLVGYEVNQNTLPNQQGLTLLQSLRSAKGIGIGSTVAQLRAAYPSVTFSTSTAGNEFSVPTTNGTDALRGFVSASTDTGTITAIGGGDLCIFR